MTDICTATGGARYNCNLPPTVSRRSRGHGGMGGGANGAATRFVTRLGAGLKDAERVFASALQHEGDVLPLIFISSF